QRANCGKSAHSTQDPSAASNSLSGLLVTLIPSLLSFTAMIILFVILRRTSRHIYMPRTYIHHLFPWQRSPASPTGSWTWVTSMFQLPDTYVLQHHSVDAYLLLRFLKLATLILATGAFISWPLLLPINATGGGEGRQLDMLSISNIAEDNYERFYAHCFIAYIFIGFVFAMITREHTFCINLRHAYLSSSPHANRTSSHTVIFSNVPESFLNENSLRSLLGQEKIKNAWFARDTTELEKKLNCRKKIALKLEAAETQLIQMENKARNKASKVKGLGRPPDHDTAGLSDNTSTSIIAPLASIKNRPAHRLGFLIGRKVDTIDWARAKIYRLNLEIEKLKSQLNCDGTQLLSLAFVEFYHQADAQVAYQTLIHHSPLCMTPRYINLDPSQIIWANARLKWWERTVRYWVMTAFVCTLIIFWAIPTTFVGSISNLDSLMDAIPCLQFMDEIPSWIRGAITNLLPSLLLSVLMGLVPRFLRSLAKWSGVFSLASVELLTQNFYFAFQIVQVFLVVSLASTATDMIATTLENPSSMATVLARKIPRTSNFYMSYIILNGLSFSASALLQANKLVLDKILGKGFDNTPRKIYIRRTALPDLQWGSLYPTFTLLTVIGIIYSCIAPLTLGFATIGLYLFYFAYRYNMLYVFNATIDTQGKSYICALQHLTVGCYLLIFCLVGVFALASSRNHVAIGPLVLMILYLIFIILYHVSMTKVMDPLLDYLPKSIDLKHDPSSTEWIDHLNHEHGESEPSQHCSSALENTLSINQSPLLCINRLLGTRFSKLLALDRYQDHRAFRHLFSSPLHETEHVENAKYHSSCHFLLNSEPPRLWIPRDPAGVSSQEIAHSRHVIPITDEYATLDENCDISFNIHSRPPDYEQISI
ncbi:hypothetical protein N7490_006289, partial [Penicillium lividum]